MKAHLLLATALSLGTMVCANGCGDPGDRLSLVSESLAHRTSSDPNDLEAERYVRFRALDRQEIEGLARVISIDRVVDHDVFAYASRGEVDSLRGAGFEPEELPHPGKNPEVTMGWGPLTFDLSAYPTYNDYVDAMHRWANDYPDLCRLVDLGPTTNETRPHRMLALKISDHAEVSEDEPEVLLTSTMHGDETVGYVLLLALADHLLSQYGVDPQVTRLVDETEIWLNPLANPDGTYFGGDDTVGNAIRSYVTKEGSYSGVDPNRSFPQAESQATEEPTVESDIKELWNETSIMVDWTRSRHFVLSANFHGGAEVVNFPWDSMQRRHPDDSWWQAIARKYATLAQTDGPSGYMTDLENGITNGWDWYPVFGGRQDFVTYSCNGRESTLEVSSRKNPPATQLSALWQANRRALLEYMGTSLSGIRGLVLDADGHPLAADIEILGLDQAADRSWVTTDPEVGDFHRMLLPGIYNVRIRVPGRLTAQISNVQVVAGDATRVDVTIATE